MLSTKILAFLPFFHRMRRREHACKGRVRTGFDKKFSMNILPDMERTEGTKEST